MRRFRSMKTLLLVTALSGTVAVGILLGPSNIDPIHQFSWSENTGWMNWRDANAGTDGVVVGTDFLSGYIWSENRGWINVGDGAGPYANTNGSNFGVNILGNGDLDGFAWGENKGWINFGWGAGSGDPKRARFDTAAGRFRGYAWAENHGWINLDDSTHYVGADVAPDPLEAGPNPWAPDPLGGRLNRAGSFKMPASAAGLATIRVTLADLYIDSNVDPVNGCPVRTGGLADLTAFNGRVRYLGPPSARSDNDGAAPKFVTAELQSTPFFRDWSPAGLTTTFGAGVDTSTIYYYGVEVFPCSVHEVQQGTQSGVFSSPALVVRTAFWGDVWPPFGDVSFTDIGKVVDAFKSIPFIPGNPPKGAPRKVRAMLRDNSAPFDSTINFTDIGRTVDAFKTIAYDEDGP